MSKQSLISIERRLRRRPVKPPNRRFIFRDQLPSKIRLIGLGVTMALVQLITAALGFVLSLVVIGAFQISATNELLTLIVILTLVWLGPLIEIHRERRNIATWSRAAVVGLGAGLFINFLIQPFKISFDTFASWLEIAAWVALYFAIPFGWVLSNWLVTRLFWGPVVILERGACLSCGYDLTGNISGACPECGARIENLFIRPADMPAE